jgi:hypothetical protein
VTDEFGQIDPYWRAANSLSVNAAIRKIEAPTLFLGGRDEVVGRRAPASSERDVPLSASLIALLRRHRKEQNERRLLAGKAFRSARARVGLEGVRVRSTACFAPMLVKAETGAGPGLE